MLLDVSRRGGWTFDAQFSETKAAHDWGVPTHEWEKLDPGHIGQMSEFTFTQTTMDNWENWANRPKPKP